MMKFYTMFRNLNKLNRNVKENKVTNDKRNKVYYIVDGCVDETTRKSSISYSTKA